MRRGSLEVRKAALARCRQRPPPDLRRNEYVEADGPTVFAHAKHGRRR
jgi:hypothetical protein